MGVVPVEGGRGGLATGMPPFMLLPLFGGEYLPPERGRGGKGGEATLSFAGGGGGISPPTSMTGVPEGEPSSITMLIVPTPDPEERL